VLKAPRFVLRNNNLEPKTLVKKTVSENHFPDAWVKTTCQDSVENTAPEHSVHETLNWMDTFAGDTISRTLK